MKSENALPYHPDTHHQLNSLKPPIWKAIFILLLMVNVILGSVAVVIIYSVFRGERTHTSEGGRPLLIALPLVLTLVIIDAGALLSYIFRYPRGSATVVFSAVFILTILALLTFSVLVIRFFV